MAADMEGAFRDVQFHLSQSGGSQDMEVHYIEVHLADLGVSKESL